MGRFNWGVEGPPKDAYERVTEPERFAVLHDVADEVVAGLCARFDARVTHLSEPPTFMHVPDAIKVLRLEPPKHGAPITIAWTPFPGLRLSYGWWHEEPFPVCGCDACDEDGDSESLNLRERVADIVDRGFQEELSFGRFRVPDLLISDDVARELDAEYSSQPEQWLLRIDWTGTHSSGTSAVLHRLGELVALQPAGLVTWPAWG